MLYEKTLFIVYFYFKVKVSFIICECFVLMFYPFPTYCLAFMVKIAIGCHGLRQGYF